MAFERVAKMMELKINVKKVINLTDDFDLNDIDIIFINPGELGVILNVINAMKKRKKEICKYIEDSYLIVIGTSGAILSKKIYTLEGKVYQGLELIDMECYQRNNVIGDDLYFSIQDEQDIIGSQIQMLDFKVNPDYVLGKVKYGFGNCGKNVEGAIINNVIFTNALGPVFVKNPWWTERILKKIAEKKKIKFKPVLIDDFELEIKSFNSTKKFIKGKMDRV